MTLFKRIFRYSEIFTLRKCSSSQCIRFLRRASGGGGWNPSYLHSVGRRPLQYQNIGQCLQRAADKWPHRPFVISHSEGVSMTFSQILEESDRLAAGLIESGLQNGDKVGICSPNSLRWLTTLFASSRAGLIAVPINPAYQERELKFCLNKVGIKALAIPSSFKNQYYYEIIRTIAPEIATCNPEQLNSSSVPSLKSIITLDDEKLRGVLTYKELISQCTSTLTQSMSSRQNVISSDSGFAILFTSGTTGEPKAALLSHFTYVNNSWEFGYRNEFEEKEQRLCLQIPLFHAFGLLTALSALQYGTTIVIPGPAYSPLKAVEAITEKKCTVVTGTPTMYVDLVNYQRKNGGQLGNLGGPIQGVETAITGGAPCSWQLGEQIRDYLGVKSLKSVYGMTEACVIFSSSPGDDIHTATDTVGKLFGHTEAKIVDEEGNVVAMGVPGELCIRGYANMQGYFADPQKTADVITHDKWMRTGDQFVLHDDGYGSISGRLKDIIIRGGENIFPKEIEDFLNTHPDIIESHVFGVKDDRLGEEICASVRLREGADFDYSKLKKFCEGAIANFKVPRHLRIVRQFPLTPSGKVQKFKLKKMVESGQL